MTASLSSTYAAPNPNQVGVCYFFRGEELEIKQSCVVSSGYGAGAHYTTLNWIDEVETVIYSIHYCPESDLNDDAFCKHLVDDYQATPYERNTFLQSTDILDVDNVSCFRVVKTGNSVCYRI